jgi:hypothetical protein
MIRHSTYLEIYAGNTVVDSANAANANEIRMRSSFAWQSELSKYDVGVNFRALVHGLPRDQSCAQLALDAPKIALNRFWDLILGLVASVIKTKLSLYLRKHLATMQKVIVSLVLCALVASALGHAVLRNPVPWNTQPSKTAYASFFHSFLPHFIPYFRTPTAFQIPFFDLRFSSWRINCVRRAHIFRFLHLFG